MIAVFGPALAQTIPGPTAPTIPIPHVNIGITPATKPADVALSLQILLLLTVLDAGADAARADDVVHAHHRRALVRAHGAGHAVEPAQPGLAGLAMFLTFFVMSPVIEDINKNALQPYLEQKISPVGGHRPGAKALAGVHVPADPRKRHRASSTR